MKLAVLSIYALSIISTVCSLPYYGTEEGYNRRPDSPKVKQQLVEYWSRPDVVVRMPDEMRSKVIEYVDQNPQYRWVPTVEEFARMRAELDEEDRKRGHAMLTYLRDLEISPPSSEDDRRGEGNIL
jgi:hypothetical protein